MTTNPALTRASTLVDLGLRACEAFQRPDLTTGLHRVQRKLSDPEVQVVIVGEFKQGKSSLVNALIGTPVCPVDDDIATAVPTYLRYGDQPSVALLHHTETADGEHALRREPIAPERLRAAILERGHPDAVSAAEIRLPRKLLHGGLVLVDTPGVGGLGSAHAAATLAAASLANALLFVTDSAQELTRTELDFLHQARAMCPTVICVQTKTDIYPAWRKVKALTDGHLADAGINTPVIGVSSTLRTMAAQAEDAELNAESGFPELIRALGETVGGGAEKVLAADASAAVVAVCTQLEAQFQGERAALADPEQAHRVVSELTDVQERVRTLKSAAARWNQTLSDGITDLTSDIDHDLRSRIRRVIAEAEESIEQSDPADTWEETESWLKARAAHELLANYNQLRERATELSELVGQHFRQASGEVLDQIAVPNPQPVMAGEEVDHRIELDKMNVTKQAMVALKSAYGGAVMFVMLGVMTGVTLGPIAVGIGLVMGHRGLREEKKRQRLARQKQAAAAVRRYCDQVSFVMGKDSRDTLRIIQRQLRDHYTELAEQLERSNNDALKKATTAANSSKAERQRRLADLDAELDRLRQLRERAEQSPSTAPSPEAPQR